MNIDASILNISKPNQIRLLLYDQVMIIPGNLADLTFKNQFITLKVSQFWQDGSVFIPCNQKAIYV